ncbi:MAG TPA: nucleoside recognition domain-containing protein [Clostridia bacterium]|nr:nucleoside recognition domain-containing protein [Clostridia bacterium]
MNWLWGLMLAGGLIAGALNGDPGGAADALVTGMSDAVTLCLSLMGAYMLWMGLMNVAKEAGLVDSLSRAVKPVFKGLFPDSPQAVAPVTLNLAANFFGLGSAATPFGLKAMHEFEKTNPQKGVATHDMCMFLCLNAAAIELLPTNVLAMRAVYGSQDVYAVVLPTLVSSALAFFAAFLMARVLRKR